MTCMSGAGREVTGETWAIPYPRMTGREQRLGAGRPGAILQGHLLVKVLQIVKDKMGSPLGALFYFAR